MIKKKKLVENVIEKYVCYLSHAIKSQNHKNVQVRTSIALPSISLFWHQQTNTAVSIIFSGTIHYTLLDFPCFYFFFIDHTRKQVLFIKWFILVFVNVLNFSQLNVQAATTKKERQSTLSSIIFIKHVSYIIGAFFLWFRLWKRWS